MQHCLSLETRILVDDWPGHLHPFLQPIVPLIETAGQGQLDRYARR
ncbi:MAG: hypothetical protein KGL25_01995 [Gammaproteobacteria bacterium]|nr:hypothetical protein [Gammaproteobacteria bacterium]MDE2250164.1 hypothetical protein [Gammaproteobacteria bacterium]